MNTPQITELIKDASYALAILAEVTSPAFRQAAVRQLASIVREFHDIEFAPNHPDIANQLQAATPEQPAAAKERPVIDLAMKYRTRDGREVTELHIRDNLRFPIWGIVEGQTRNWDEEGFFMDRGKRHGCDLIPTGERA
jgi:CxxC motif-containing protein (DUF1111 family)